ncbi:MAG: hypothetical protein B6244_02850 [Candidatus Cloacimonetes bacterium 4572_55]|nr:MAG: hypothetical protein B6244_02850 [Candidatus Cloacimonetes bacterium 4572_55]
MMRPVTQRFHARLQLLAFISVFCWAILAFRLGIIQIARANYYQELGAKMSEEKIELKPQRGNIFDRNGILLATDVDAESFFAVPDQVDDPEHIAHAFSLFCNEDYDRIIANLNKPTQFVWLSRRVEKGIASEIRRKKLKGVHSITDTKRYYPHNEVAAHILGFVGDDGDGLEGIEKQFNTELSGQSGWTILLKDARGKDRSFPDSPPKKPMDGQNLFLTIDVHYQEIVEQELRRVTMEQEAEGGMFVLMDPRTGEILASAVQPTFDLNNAHQTDVAVRRNRVVTDSYEPGSTFKFLTAAIALEEQVMEPNAAIYCEQGSFDLGVHEFHDATKYGWLTFTQVIEKSSNVGVYKIAKKIGSPMIYEYALKFGFGCETGSGLTGETRGTLRPPSQWSSLSIMAIPIGQEVSVTVLQQVTSFSVIANHGVLLEPQILYKTEDQNGRVVQQAKPKVIRQVISQRTADILTGILTGVVKRGTGTSAQIPGIEIAGKTGTAQKKMPGIQGYAPNTYVASFLSFFPADAPKLTAIAVIDEPKKQSYGGDVAAPLFKAVAQRLISTYDILPNYIHTDEITTQNFPLVISREGDGHTIVTKDWRGMALTAARTDIRLMGLFTETIGDKTERVWSQFPDPGTLVHHGDMIRLTIDPPPSQGEVDMPKVVGKSLREAKRILDKHLLEVTYVGGGIVVDQMPVAGTKTLPGEQCHIVARY